MSTTAYSLASNNNSIVQCPIHVSFDLDEALTNMNITDYMTAPVVEMDSGHQKTGISNDLVVSSLASAAGDGVCMVCMEDFQPAFLGKQVPCGHVFHATCIATWVSLCNSCPLCRSRCIVISGVE